ncbi:MAG: N-acetylglucosamine-6-phosphate deacetylase [Bacteroidota bacterium]|nr:N-acetylglucosamine-6-phosphate deacetylase [Bacteroidota bacterium]
MPIAFIANRIFTGTQWLHSHAVVCVNSMISGLIAVNELPQDIEREMFPDCFIVPAFIDLQIYGAYGKLLSVYPEKDSLVKLKEYSEKGGAAFCLPTVATNTIDVFYKCIDAVKEYWSKEGEGIIGLHLEGPWINPLKRGAHIESLIHPPTIQEVTELLNYGKGVIKMITLAPELCSQDVIELILSHQIVISAGHSNATYAEAKTGFANGITAVTHLYNAMSPLQHRQPGLVGAAMDDLTVMASIIPDGHHVDFSAIRIAKQVMKERLFVITDAVTETTEGPYQHLMTGDKYEADTILSGSALTMIKAMENLVNFTGIELGEALRMCSGYPAKIIGLKEQGKIEKGCLARMLVIDDKTEPGQYRVKQML